MNKIFVIFCCIFFVVSCRPCKEVYLPDLSTSALVFPLSILTGISFDITGITRNSSGNKKGDCQYSFTSAGLSKTLIVISQGGGIELDSIIVEIPVLEEGEEYPFSIPFKIFNSGTLLISAITDWENQVEESDENNNGN